MTEMLQEFVDSRGVGVRVDRTKGVIRGVKILGVVSRNGRTYLPDALTEAVGLYEQAKVNVNHPKGSPAAVRDYQDRIGKTICINPGQSTNELYAVVFDIGNVAGSLEHNVFGN